MTSPKLPYGQWPSPLTPATMASALRLGTPTWAGQRLVWVEQRSGHGVLVASRPQETARDVTADLNVRAGVGYGGGQFTVHGDDAFFCCADGRLYRTHLDHGRPRPLTPAFGAVASPRVSPDGRWVVYVHSDGTHDALAAVDTQGTRWPWKLADDADFFMQPAFSPDGRRLAWVAWDQLNMPWTGTRLVTAPILDEGPDLRLGDAEIWAGDDGAAIQQPAFSPDGRWLAYLSDAPGFSQICLRDLHTGQVRVLTDGPNDHSGPAWVQGLRFIVWRADSQRVLATRYHQGHVSLITVGLDGEVHPVPGTSPYTAFSQPDWHEDGRVAFLASSSQQPERVISVTPTGAATTHAFSTRERVLPAHLSPVRSLTWTPPGHEMPIYANFYPPHHPRQQGDGLPPAIVLIHGGPSVQSLARYHPTAQFFATRGFAVLDLNYRGSTGYGRAYSDALAGQWGVYDVEDAVSAVAYLGEAGLADPRRVAIMGGSAGGYTVLQTLTDHPGAFAAGVCMYGISNLFTLDATTHKFEASYCQWLIGALPETADTWRARSPIFKADRISDPVAIYHGAQDKAVPIAQAEAIVGSLRARNAPHRYHVYEDEGHGWRKAPNIDHFYTDVLEFLTETLATTL